MVACPKLVEQPFNTFGDAIKAVDYTVDMYSTCRKRHDALIEFERKRK